MSGQYHWPPRAGDRVYQYSRAEREVWPHGEIMFLRRSSEEIVVHFYVPASVRRYSRQDIILTYDGSNHWSFRDVPKGFIRVNCDVIKIDVNKFAYTPVNEELKWGGCNQLETFTFDEFDGNWSSSDGGNKRWEIE